jgi:glycosyltransferase involved in cell wall biosynthesis
MADDSAARIIFDVTTSIRWTGPPVGIVRVERELALWALANLPNVTFVFFDPREMAYHEVKAELRAFLAGDAALDTMGLTSPAKPGRRKIDRAPAALRPLVLWVAQARRMLLGRLEAVRLGETPPWLRRLAAALQEPLMSKKYRKIMVGTDGQRRPFMPYQMILGQRITFLPSDVLICAGAGWSHTNIRTIRELKSRAKFRFVLLCYDLIPLLFPQFYLKHDVDMFRAYMRDALAIADLIIVTSRRTEEDCKAYGRQHGITTGKIAVSPLGFDVGNRDLRLPSLPNGLERERYVLFVSTIEPRKGHRLLYNIWHRLAADGVTGAAGFKLVFVGRPGWLVDDLLLQLRSNQAQSDQILTIPDVGDDLLQALYEGAAFCVYPSQYEGYGLPICEAFSRGKAVLASTGGALPEIVRDLSPCLDPDDEEAWYKAIRQWIEHPELRVQYEDVIKLQFSHPTWREAAADFFAAGGPSFGLPLYRESKL